MKMTQLMEKVIPADIKPWISQRKKTEKTFFVGWQKVIVWLETLIANLKEEDVKPER